jgi:hypothetical protein
MTNTILLIIILAVVLFIAFMVAVQGQQIHDLLKKK